MPFKLHTAGYNFRTDNRHALYAAKVRQNPLLELLRKFRGSARWQKVQRNQVQKHPTCYDPFKHHEAAGLPALTNSVHHIIGLRECHRLGLLDILGYMPSNLRSLCNGCHSEIEGNFISRGEVASKRIFITEEEEQEIIRNANDRREKVTS